MREVLIVRWPMAMAMVVVVVLRGDSVTFKLRATLHIHKAEYWCVTATRGVP